MTSNLSSDDLAAWNAEIYRRGAELQKEAERIGVSALYLSIAVGMTLEGVIPSLRLIEPSQCRPAMAEG